MYKIKRGQTPPSRVQYPWEEMEPLDYFECNVIELAAIKMSAKKMSTKFTGFKIEVAKVGDSLTVWLISKGTMSPDMDKVEKRVFDVLDRRRGWVTEGIVCNQIKTASKIVVMNLLSELVIQNKILCKENVHPKKLTTFKTYRIK